MLNEFCLNALAGSWFTAVALVVACGLAVGVQVAPGAMALPLGLALMPPAMVLLLARSGARPMAQVVHALNPQDRAGRS